MSGLETLFGVWDIKVMPGRHREQEAKQLLEKLADQVKPICVAHKWNVRILEEFIPSRANLLGMNVNRQKILIRLRPARALDSFYPYESLLHTMLHELVHMEIGPHNDKFFKMLDELREECEDLMRQGISGRNMPFAGEGRTLGGVRAPVNGRAAALKAAERRQRQQTIMGGGRRLGGHGGVGGKPADHAAAAAECTNQGMTPPHPPTTAGMRQAVSRGCATTNNGTAFGPSSDIEAGRSSASGLQDDGWNCAVCTLHNKACVVYCEMCATPRPCASPVSTHGGGSSGIRKANPGRPSWQGGKTAGRTKDPAVEIPTKRAYDAAMDLVNARRSSPVLSTWTCLKCPFLFPNSAERLTCESCGAPKGEKNTRAVATKGEAWACGVCTVLNPTTLPRCGTCETTRPSLSRSDVSEILVEHAGHDPSGAPSSDSRRTRQGRWTCSVCTLRNTAKDVACAACGIPRTRQGEVDARAPRPGAEEGYRSGMPNGADLIDLT